MSQALSVIGAATALAGTFRQTLMLGPVAMSGIMTDDVLPWGGSQRMAVHKLPGGARVIDVMGRDDADLAWRGYLEGPLAMPSALAIDALRIGGQVQTLTWDVQSFNVVVAEFIADYRYTSWIPYRIRCVVLADNSANATTAQPSLASSVMGDISSALGVNLPSSSAIISGLQTAQTAVAAVGAFIPGGTAMMGSLTAMAQAQGAIGDLAAASTGTIGGILGGAGGIAGVLGTMSPLSAIGNLGSLTAASGTAAAAAFQGAFLGRAVGNLQGSFAP